MGRSGFSSFSEFLCVRSQLCHTDSLRICYIYKGSQHDPIFFSLWSLVFNTVCVSVSDFTFALILYIIPEGSPPLQEALVSCDLLPSPSLLQGLSVGDNLLILVMPAKQTYSASHFPSLLVVSLLRCPRTWNSHMLLSLQPVSIRPQAKLF